MTLANNNTHQANKDSGEEFDPTTEFCLFRIPKQGGRVIWEVTNSCNYGCRYCIFSSTSRKPKEELDTNQIKSTIDSLKENGFTHLKITGGEPFMRPDMIEILEYARQQGLKTDISTNASMITSEFAENIAKINLEMVHVSLDGHTLAIQEAIRGKKTFNPTINGIKELVAHNIYVRIGCVIYKGNQDNLENIVELCIQLGVNEVIFSLMEPVGRLRGKTTLICDQTIKTLKANLQIITEKYKNKIKVSFNFAESQNSSSCSSCPGGERFLFIDHKGKISPCTWVFEHRPDYISKESLHTHTLSELLNAKENLAFKKLANELKNTGLYQCPMQEIALFKESEIISNFFNKSAEEFTKNEKYSTTSAIYPFTTENISGYFPLLNLQDSDVLTVGGSGDHWINAHYFGAKKVDCFDVNLFAKYYTELKIAALNNMSFKEFKKFLFPSNGDFDFHTYNTLRSTISVQARYFFDNAYEYSKSQNILFRESTLFRNNYETIEGIINNNPYLQSESNFDRAKKAVQGKKINWLCTTLEELPSHIENQYECILLSNIADYAHINYPQDRYLKYFRDNCILPLLNSLKSRGKILIAYIYDGSNICGSSKRSDINIEKVRADCFGNIPDTSYTEHTFTSVLSNGNFDLIAVINNTDICKKIISLDEFKASVLTAATNTNEFTNFFHMREKELFNIYSTLEDQLSKDCFVNILAYRASLGNTSITTNKTYADNQKRVKELTKNQSIMNLVSKDGYICHFSIPFEDKQIYYDGEEKAVLGAFFQKQYYLTRDSIRISPEKGDIVLDVGSFLGENSLAFACSVGESGKVFSFDFFPPHIKAMQFNLSQNPELQSRIEMINFAVSSTSNNVTMSDNFYMNYDVRQGLSYIPFEQSGLPVSKVTLDDFVIKRNINKIDFLKMDIEGEELNALIGAQGILTKHAPKLAISIYHKNEDLYTIADFITKVNPEYKLYIDHYTDNINETILYAI